MNKECFVLHSVSSPKREILKDILLQNKQIKECLKCKLIGSSLPANKQEFNIFTYQLRILEPGKEWIVNEPDEKIERIMLMMLCCRKQNQEWTSTYFVI